MLNIAGIDFQIDGGVYDYTSYRFRNYNTNERTADVKISYKESSCIQTPVGNEVARNDYRIFLENNGDYINYDTLEVPKMNTAYMKSDSEWTCVETALSDVEHLGGASLSVRLFNMLGEVFKYSLIKRNGFVVHSSSLSYKDNGILFSAPSGTGKSTHTGLWEKVYKEDVKIVNDDMPAVRKIDGIWKLCGTPWSGKSEKNLNLCVPLKAFVFLERGEKNELIRLPAAKGVFMLLNQTLLPVYRGLMNEMMNSISEALTSVPCYILKCNISEEAPKIVKEGIIDEN